MSSNSAASDNSAFENVDLKNRTINEALGVSLSQHQKVLVGSVLDLFEGHPTLKHLALWHPSATFQDPIAVAQGSDRIAAQWYGLPVLFKPINILSHEVTSSGNPIELKLRNKYVLKGLKKEQVVDSIVKIEVAEDGRIQKVEDRWNDKLPSGAISEAFRKLNGATMPSLVKVPKNAEEDAQMRSEREEM